MNFTTIFFKREGDTNLAVIYLYRLTPSLLPEDVCRKIKYWPLWNHKATNTCLKKERLSIKIKGSWVFDIMKETTESSILIY